MAGGTWDPLEKKVLPGLYLNFQAAGLATIQAGDRGTIIMPVKANWGPVRKFVTIASEKDIYDTYTNDESHGETAYTCLRLALLGGAQKILAYRLADTAAAKETIKLLDTSNTQVLQLTTKYETVRPFKVTVRDNLIDSSKYDLILYDDTTLLYTFSFNKDGAVNNAVNAINNDSNNLWITATKIADGDGTLAAISSQTFEGGNEGLANITAQDYINFLNDAETQQFNILTLDGISDSAIQTSVASWIERVRSEGKGVMAVMGGSLSDDTGADAFEKAKERAWGFNHEGIISVGTGAILDDVKYSSAQVAAYVAGLIGGQKMTESTTYAKTPFDDVTRRWTIEEQKEAIQNGIFLLINDGRQVKVLEGINSLITLRQGQSDAWKKIRAIRTMDAINDDLLQTAEDNYIGKINNTEEGRLALIGAAKEYMRTLAQGGVIEATGWDVYLDPDYYGQNATLTPEADQVFIKWEAYITDVMEKIFGTFIVK
ncbi:phage tail sheath family protein [Thermoanaerobacterium sp. CMT5567-10]|uniref:phage tail sheath family protein n=1 Tax=Thermoanaerobacterium sp. CMT5567-10 TaxID=3061989 RepID=UPI0026DF6BF7|nr:phage tail sheath family protein [Thermoanaerobacterium sp. CMT5567-10]WKV08199.1 phage tail sheath family protein [Thermoanaerobacterium sp. CMT5567-10]